MCATCGCSTDHEHELEHHDHDHTHDHPHPASGHPLPEGEGQGAANPRADAGRSENEVIRLERDLLEKNDRIARENRAWLTQRGILALNLLSSPGAGKTTLLEKTVRDWQEKAPIFVIEGDQETERDADRIRAAGARALQIQTGTACHLDAEMIRNALDEVDPPAGSLLFIENVGNLVCPALFDLGESAKVVIASTTEGDDKPVKYPHMFRAANLVLLNKIDLLPHVPFSEERFRDGLAQVHPGVPLLPACALRDDGLSMWYNWIRERNTESNEGRTETRIA